MRLIPLGDNIRDAIRAIVRKPSADSVTTTNADKKQWVCLKTETNSVTYSCPYDGHFWLGSPPVEGQLCVCGKAKYRRLRLCEKCGQEIQMTEPED